MAKPKVLFVGADKGGVGKTTVSRIVEEYLAANGIETKKFDTQHPGGSFARFYPATKVIDITKSDDQMLVFDDLQPGSVTLLDVAASMLTPSITLLRETGFFDDAKAGKLDIVILHVLGPATQSLDEVKHLLDTLEGARYIPVANHIDATEYVTPPDAVIIPKLDGDAAKLVDHTALPFSKFIESNESRVQRGKVRHWLQTCYAALDAVKLLNG